MARDTLCPLGIHVLRAEVGAGVAEVDNALDASDVRGFDRTPEVSLGNRKRGACVHPRDNSATYFLRGESRRAVRRQYSSMCSHCSAAHTTPTRLREPTQTRPPHPSPARPTQRATSRDPCGSGRGGAMFHVKRRRPRDSRRSWPKTRGSSEGSGTAQLEFSGPARRRCPVRRRLDLRVGAALGSESACAEQLAIHSSSTPNVSRET